ncbi:hypothetical protein [Halomicrococcus sp. NG-SE-24]|uniref:hypothetical protein n=1 Tax=Halomicrococcus sp. NG-SE-24 TaxID=3436928 RepID=UPI003D98EC73
MSIEADDEASNGRILSPLRERVSRRHVVMLSLGVLAGFSIGVFDKSVVTVPVIGPVSGWLLGTIGLLVVAVIYYRQGGNCGCTGDCDGNCSV